MAHYALVYELATPHLVFIGGTHQEALCNEITSYVSLNVAKIKKNHFMF